MRMKILSSTVTHLFTITTIDMKMYLTTLQMKTMIGLTVTTITLISRLMETMV